MQETAKMMMAENKTHQIQCFGWIVLDPARVPRFLTESVIKAPNIGDNTPRITPKLNQFSENGSKINKTPIKPIKATIRLNQPTTSFIINGASKVIKIGIVWKRLQPQPVRQD